ncbi:MAG TPA: LPS assembly lipoprotein LptE [Patescibacteria group bacterium]|nr:LPS assembly lipoprotein LptE [Patescibacteria group bacterium]
MNGCYTFTGGNSLPEHLQTIYIPPVTDNTGLGTSQYRDAMGQFLVAKFRNDNSLRVVESGGDSRLTVTMASATEAAVSIRPGERERERRLTMALDVEFYDAVQRRQMWRRTFTENQNYDVTGDPQRERDRAVRVILDRISDQVVISVISNW